jgi:OFA family oxalate/formate antiporter-like MFS transporter
MVNLRIKIKKSSIVGGVYMPAKTSRTLVLTACACSVFWPGSFIFGLPGVLRQHWQQFFDASDSEVGGVVFIILIGATCFMYLSGHLQERYGPGRLAFIGSVMCGGSAIYLSQSGNMAEVNVWAFIVGASSAFIYLPGLTVVQRWFPERRGLAAGFFNMAFGLSAAAMSLIFSTERPCAINPKSPGGCDYVSTYHL